MARTCWRVSSNGAIGLTTATPPCREISAATQPIRRMLVSRSSLEKVSPAERFRRTTSPSRLVTVRSPCSSSRSTSARASVDLPLPDRPVKKSTSPCRSGGGRSWSTTAATRAGSSPASSSASAWTGSPAANASTTRTPSAWSASASPCAGSGTVTTTASGSSAGGRAGGAHQADRRQPGRAGAGEGEQGDRAEPGQLLDLGGGERVADRDDGAAGVPLAVGRRREHQLAERAVLRVGQRVDDAAGPRDPGQRQPLGVDQLDRADRAGLGGHRRRAGSASPGCRAG